VVDLVYNPHGGPRPEVLITDQGSYEAAMAWVGTCSTAAKVSSTAPTATAWKISSGRQLNASSPMSHLTLTVPPGVWYGYLEYIIS
jgi:hypothetical protein